MSQKDKLVSLKDRAKFFGAKLEKTAVVETKVVETKTTTLKTLKKVDGKTVEKSEKTSIAKLKAESKHFSHQRGIIQINHPAVSHFLCLFPNLS